MAIRFLATNLWDTATVTSLSAATGFPASNTKTRLFLEHWRSTGITAEWLKADLGADTVIRAIAIKYSNLQVGDSLNLQAQTAANGDDWDGTPPLTINVSVTITADMVSKGLIVYNWETPPTACRWWRILMTANAGSYIYVGRIFLGVFVEPENDYDKDFEDAPFDPSEILQTPTGQKYVNVRPQRQQISLSFPSINAADYAKFVALGALLGKAKAFFVELDPSGALTTKSYYVSSLSDWRPRHIYGAQLYSMALQFEEEG